LQIIQITSLSRVIFEELSYSRSFGCWVFNSVQKVRVYLLYDLAHKDEMLPVFLHLPVCLWLRTNGKIPFSAVCLINPQCLRAVLLFFSLTHLSAWLISHCILICLQQYWHCSLWGSWLLKLEEAIHYGRSCDIINYFNLYRSMELYGPNFN